MLFPLLCGVSFRKTQNKTNAPGYFKNPKMNPAQCCSQVDLGKQLLCSKPLPLHPSPSPPSSCWSCGLCLTLAVVSTGTDSQPISKKFQLRGEHLTYRESGQEAGSCYLKMGAFILSQIKLNCKNISFCSVTLSRVGLMMIGTRAHLGLGSIRVR